MLIVRCQMQECGNALLHGTRLSSVGHCWAVTALPKHLSVWAWRQSEAWQADMHQAVIGFWRKPGSSRLTEFGIKALPLDSTTKQSKGSGKQGSLTDRYTTHW